MAPQSSSSTSGLQPSYARPTAASKNHKAATDEATPRQKAQPPPSPPRPKAFHHYSLSTAASRSKARWLGSFRFLDLPPELRNLVYEHAGIERASRRVDLHHQKVDQVLHSLPELLQANKQILDEAGSYYFSSGRFEILVNRSHVCLLVDWLKLIGLSNREYLANNKNVVVMLAHDRDAFPGETLVHANDGSDASAIGCQDAAYIAGLGVEYERIAGETLQEAKTYTALQNWKFKLMSVSRKERSPHHQSHPLWNAWNMWCLSNARMSLCFLVRLRKVVKGVFALLYGKEVDFKDDAVATLAWIGLHCPSYPPGKDFEVQSPPSGRMFSIFVY